MESNMNLLFSKYDLGANIERWKEETVKFVLDLPPQEIIGTDQELLLREIVADKQQQEVSVDESRIECLEPTEVKIDVSRDPNYLPHYDSGPHYVRGTSISFLVPFVGNYQFFESTPSTRDYCPPRAILHEDHLEIVFEGTDLNPEVVNRQFQQDISDSKKYLSWINHDLTEYNNALPRLIRDALKQRTEKNQKDAALASKLKYPIRPRSSSPLQTINATPKRKISPREKRLLGRCTPLEPSLEMAEYDHIIDIIKNMTAVMENSPKAFQSMEEEDIRQHFLVQLNGEYEGTATGETFNFTGKTDIIIRDGDRNIFIAECKFWKGRAAFLKTIDQILNYSGWRDTKTAILLFSKNNDFTSVVQQISPICCTHSNFIMGIPSKGETDFRFVFSHKNDASRRLYLAVLAFNIPYAQSS